MPLTLPQKQLLFLHILMTCNKEYAPSSTTSVKDVLKVISNDYNVITRSDFTADFEPGLLTAIEKNLAPGAGPYSLHSMPIAVSFHDLAGTVGGGWGGLVHPPMAEVLALVGLIGI